MAPENSINQRETRAISFQTNYNLKRAPIFATKLVQAHKVTKVPLNSSESQSGPIGLNTVHPKIHVFEKSSEAAASLGHKRSFTLRTESRGSQSLNREDVPTAT